MEEGQLPPAQSAATNSQSAVLAANPSSEPSTASTAPTTGLAPIQPVLQLKLEVGVRVEARVDLTWVSGIIWEIQEQDKFIVVFDHGASAEVTRDGVRNISTVNAGADPQADWSQILLQQRNTQYDSEPRPSAPIADLKPDDIFQSGAKTSKATYINERVKLIVGKTVKDALTLRVPTSKEGVDAKYSRADMLYDIKHCFIAVPESTGDGTGSVEPTPTSPGVDTDVVDAEQVQKEAKLEAAAQIELEKQEALPPPPKRPSVAALLQQQKQKQEEQQQQLKLSEWVQCDQPKCGKWRRIPKEAVDSLPAKWFCTMNRWDAAHASCDTPEEQFDEEISPADAAASIELDRQEAVGSYEKPPPDTFDEELEGAPSTNSNPIPLCALCLLPSQGGADGGSAGGSGKREPGDLLPHPVVMVRSADGKVKQSVWVHHECAVHSAEVKVDFKGRLCYVASAIKRGRQLKCTGCKQKGATVGCFMENCPRNYHFPCVPNQSAKISDHSGFLCSTHAKSNELPLSFCAQLTASAIAIATKTVVAATAATQVAAEAATTAAERASDSPVVDAASSTQPPVAPAPEVDINLTYGWVECAHDRCGKWRRVPSSSADVIGAMAGPFYCALNKWDPKHATCVDAEEKMKWPELETDVQRWAMMAKLGSTTSIDGGPPTQQYFHKFVISAWEERLKTGKMDAEEKDAMKQAALRCAWVRMWLAELGKERTRKDQVNQLRVAGMTEQAGLDAAHALALRADYSGVTPAQAQTQLARFYQKFNPERLPYIPQILSRYPCHKVVEMAIDRYTAAPDFICCSADTLGEAQAELVRASGGFKQPAQYKVFGGIAEDEPAAAAFADDAGGRRSSRRGVSSGPSYAETAGSAGEEEDDDDDSDDDDDDDSDDNNSGGNVGGTTRSGRQVKSRLLTVDGQQVLRSNNYTMSEGGKSVAAKTVSDSGAQAPRGFRTCFMIFSAMVRNVLAPKPAADAMELDGAAEGAGTAATAKSIVEAAAARIRAGREGEGEGAGTTLDVGSGSKLIAAQWAAMEGDDKQPFMRLAEEDKERYEREQEAYTALLQSEQEAAVLAEAAADEKARAKKRKLQKKEKKRKEEVQKRKKAREAQQSKAGHRAKSQTPLQISNALIAANTEDAVMPRARFMASHWELLQPFRDGGAPPPAVQKVLSARSKEGGAAAAGAAAGVAEAGAAEAEGGGGSTDVVKVSSNDMEIKEEVFPAEEVKATLRDYQLAGLRWLVTSYENGISAILADEMGLGKTLQTISYIAYLKYRRGIEGPHLVVAPLSVLGSWLSEFKRWCPTLNVVRLHSADARERDRLRKLLTSGEDEKGNIVDVFVTTYDMLKSANMRRTFCGRVRFRYLVLDEGHIIKNEKSQIAVVCRKVKYQGCLLLTGTPLQNNLHELWSILNFLFQDIFPSSKAFDNCFDLGKHQVDHAMLEKAHYLMQPFMLRRVKAEVEKGLSPKLETKIYCSLSSLQTKLYKELLLRDAKLLTGPGMGSGAAVATAGSESAAAEDDESTDEWRKLQSLLMQLRKCCNHPYLFAEAEAAYREEVEAAALEPEEQEETRGQAKGIACGEDIVQVSGKMGLLDKLLVKLKQKGHRVVLFSQFTRMLDILDDYCVMRGFKYCRLDGSTNRVQRSVDIQSFNAPGSELFIFLMSTRAGGMGVNLQTADTCILYDSDWNPQVDLQAMARVHRIGQKKTVHCYRLVVKGAVEERVLQRSEQKLFLDQMVNRGSTAKAKQLQKMDTKALMATLTFGADAIFNAAASNTGNVTKSNDQGMILPTDQELEMIIDRTRGLDDTGAAKPAPPPAVDSDEEEEAQAAAAAVAAIAASVASGESRFSDGQALTASSFVAEQADVDIRDFALLAEEDGQGDGGRRTPAEAATDDAKMVDVAVPAAAAAAAAPVEEAEPVGLIAGRKKRKRNSRFIEVDGHQVLKQNNYSMEEGERSVFDQEIGQNNEKANARNKKKGAGGGNTGGPSRQVAGRDFDHIPWCLACWDGGEICCCDYCPASFHLDCLGLKESDLGGGSWSCPHHSCSDCGRKAAAAGGLLFRCECCAGCWCEDCLPSAAVVVGECARFRNRGYRRAQGCYIHCSAECATFNKAEAPQLEIKLVDSGWHKQTVLDRLPEDVQSALVRAQANLELRWSDLASQEDRKQEERWYTEWCASKPQQLVFSYWSETWEVLLKAQRKETEALLLRQQTNQPASGSGQAKPVAGKKKSKKRGGGKQQRLIPCNKCAPCTRPDCGECRHCKDKPVFGGPGRLKQRCLMRACAEPVLGKSSYMDAGGDMGFGNVGGSNGGSGGVGGATLLDSSATKLWAFPALVEKNPKLANGRVLVRCEQGEGEGSYFTKSGDAKGSHGQLGGFVELKVSAAELHDQLLDAKDQKFVQQQLQARRSELRQKLDREQKQRQKKRMSAELERNTKRHKKARQEKLRQWEDAHKSAWQEHVTMQKEELEKAREAEKEKKKAIGEDKVREAERLKRRLWFSQQRRALSKLNGTMQKLWKASRSTHQRLQGLLEAASPEDEEDDGQDLGIVEGWRGASVFDLDEAAEQFLALKRELESWRTSEVRSLANALGGAHISKNKKRKVVKEVAVAEGDQLDDDMDDDEEEDEEPVGRGRSRGKDKKGKAKADTKKGKGRSRGKKPVEEPKPEVKEQPEDDDSEGGFLDMQAQQAMEKDLLDSESFSVPTPYSENMNRDGMERQLALLLTFPSPAHKWLVREGGTSTAKGLSVLSELEVKTAAAAAAAAAAALLAKTSQVDGEASLSTAAAAAASTDGAAAAAAASADEVTAAAAAAVAAAATSPSSPTAPTAPATLPEFAPTLPEAPRFGCELPDAQKVLLLMKRTEPPGIALDSKRHGYVVISVTGQAERNGARIGDRLVALNVDRVPAESDAKMDLHAAFDTLPAVYSITLARDVDTGTGGAAADAAAAAASPLPPVSRPDGWRWTDDDEYFLELGMSVAQRFPDLCPTMEAIWQTLSSRLLPNHTPAQCERRWRLYANPQLELYSKSGKGSKDGSVVQGAPWSKDDDRLLQASASSVGDDGKGARSWMGQPLPWLTGGANNAEQTESEQEEQARWESIAEKMGKRSVGDCCCRLFLLNGYSGADGGETKRKKRQRQRQRNDGNDGNGGSEGSADGVGTRMTPTAAMTMMSLPRPTCPGCGKSCGNKGALTSHLKWCKAGQTAVTEAGADVGVQSQIVPSALSVFMKQRWEEINSDGSLINITITKDHGLKLAREMMALNTQDLRRYEKLARKARKELELRRLRMQKGANGGEVKGAKKARALKKVKYFLQTLATENKANKLLRMLEAQPIPLHSEVNEIMSESLAAAHARLASRVSMWVPAPMAKSLLSGVRNAPGGNDQMEEELAVNLVGRRVRIWWASEHQYYVADIIDKLTAKDGTGEGSELWWFRGDQQVGADGEVCGSSPGRHTHKVVYCGDQLVYTENLSCTGDWQLLASPEESESVRAMWQEAAELQVREERVDAYGEGRVVAAEVAFVAAIVALTAAAEMRILMAALSVVIPELPSAAKGKATAENALGKGDRIACKLTFTDLPGADEQTNLADRGGWFLALVTSGLYKPEVYNDDHKAGGHWYSVKGDWDGATTQRQLRPLDEAGSWNDWAGSWKRVDSTQYPAEIAHEVQWVQCDGCRKWRTLAQGMLPWEGAFRCAHNTWDELNHCSKPQQVVEDGDELALTPAQQRMQTREWGTLVAGRKATKRQRAVVKLRRTILLHDGTSSRNRTSTESAGSVDAEDIPPPAEGLALWEVRARLRWLTKSQVIPVAFSQAVGEGAERCVQNQRLSIAMRLLRHHISQLTTETNTKGCVFVDDDDDDMNEAAVDQMEEDDEADQDRAGGADEAATTAAMADLSLLADKFYDLLKQQQRLKQENLRKSAKRQRRNGGKKNAKLQAKAAMAVLCDPELPTPSSATAHGAASSKPDPDTFDEMANATSSNGDSISSGLCAFCQLPAEGDSGGSASDGRRATRFLESKPLVMARGTDGKVKQSVWVHHECAVHSAEVKADFKGRLCYVASAVKRGRQLKCTGCKQKGATVGCQYGKCQLQFHFGCVQSPHKFGESM
jgi:SWI/SNF-related matrix-associated actin-dependent regulator of chromatin subfamily A member 5